MFDRTNPVCRLFVAYMLKATHEQYSEEGCLWIVNTFYDEVDAYQGPRDVYQHAAMKTPLGYSAFFTNAERHYDLAEERRIGETGQLLYRAEMVAADIPVDFPLYVRKHENGLWKMYRKISHGKYELVPQYAKVVGFSSKAKAERRASELERTN